MSSLQEAAHPEGHDYTSGSPHLKHLGLRSRIDASIVREVARITADRGQCRALEIGAGHGTFTEVLRRAGANVTVTEMSGPSAAFLGRAFSSDRGVRVIHDADATWLDRTREDFDLVVMVSVLHHIPDYLGTVSSCAERTTPGGSFISWQDPMWYPRQSRRALLASRGLYLAWRIGQGNIVRGVKTRIRRLRGILDEREVSDMSEYHVVRRGLDEVALVSLLESHFGSVELTLYWSTQADLGQRIGERLGLTSSFGTIARGRIAASQTELIPKDLRGSRT
jgi:SAM-dependent methyltransferase